MQGCFASNESGARSSPAAGSRCQSEGSYCAKPKSEFSKGNSVMAKEIAEIPRKQTFRFTSPTATSVSVAGDFTEWQKRALPMQKGKDGIWTATVDLPPG